MDSRNAWVDYLQAAINRAGSVAELARRAELDPATIFRWRSGKTADGSVKSIQAIAQAIGDDPRNALAAAGRAPEQPTPPPPVEPEPTSLAEQIRRIRDLGLPLHQTLAAIDELIAAYERTPRRQGGTSQPRRSA